MLVAQTGDLRPKADSSPSSALGAAATKPDSYHSSALGAATRRRFVLLHDRSGSGRRWARKQIHSPSPHECGQHRQPSGQARSQIRIIRMVATRSKVVLLRLQQITSGEAPSWSLGEASPNDREGASVAFTGGTWCASDHMKQIHVPSCAQFRHGRGRRGSWLPMPEPFKSAKPFLDVLGNKLRGSPPRTPPGAASPMKAHEWLPSGARSQIRIIRMAPNQMGFVCLHYQLCHYN